MFGTIGWGQLSGRFRFPIIFIRTFVRKVKQICRNCAVVCRKIIYVLKALVSKVCRLRFGNFGVTEKRKFLPPKRTSRRWLSLTTECDPVTGVEILPNCSESCGRFAAVCRNVTACELYAPCEGYISL